MLTLRHLSPFLLLLLFAAPGAQAQTFKVQCPTHTRLHPLVDQGGLVTMLTRSPTPGYEICPRDKNHPLCKCASLATPSPQR